MEPSASKGNAPEKWDKLLNELDDKLQLGLLDRLRRVEGYSYEGGTLLIQPGSAEDGEYLAREAVSQQLSVFAGLAIIIKL
jgi:hypothetical protein